jgi:hypothetical protein
MLVAAARQVPHQAGVVGMSTDGLLGDLREFVKRHASKEDLFGNLKSPTDADVLLERIEKRLSLPKLAEHEFVVDIEQDDELKLRASLRAVRECDNNSCACHTNNYDEWGIIYGEIPVSVKFDFGRYNSWMGDYDDTHIEIMAKEPA